MTNGSDFMDEFNKWIVRVDVEDWFKRMSEYAVLADTVGLDKVPTPEAYMEEYFCDHEFGRIDADAEYEAWRDSQVE